MPHCVLEYSANIPEIPDLQDLFHQLHETLVASGHFTLDDIKSRAIRHEVFRIGDGDPRRTFVTMNLCLLSGRSDEVKTELARAVRELLERAFARTLAETTCSLTVQVSELHRPSYQKVVSPREQEESAGSRKKGEGRRGGGEEMKKRRVTKDEYKRALELIGKPGGQQLKFLQAHYSSPGRASTASILAGAAGYENFNALNLQYGTLARRVGEALEEHDANLGFLLEFNEPASLTNEHWILSMKPEFADALRELGWVHD